MTSESYSRPAPSDPDGGRFEATVAALDRRFSRFAWVVLGYSLAVIVWGYFLRVSESGDGCGTDWPLCRGTVVPLAVEFPTWVEFIHRVSSGLVLLLVAALAVWAFRQFRRGHAVRNAAAASLFFTVTESAFGAALVVYGLVATDVSTARILIRPFHVTNTFLLMASLGLTAWWSHRGVRRLPSLAHPQARMVGGAALAVLALAWSGSWTGLASTAFPAESVSQGLRQYLAPDHVLIYLRMIHPLLAVGAVVVLLKLAAEGRRTPGVPVIRGMAAALGALTAIQLLIGPLTIAFLQPAGLRVFHLFLADLLWLAVVFLGAAILEEPPGDARPAGRLEAARGRRRP